MAVIASSTAGRTYKGVGDTVRNQGYPTEIAVNLPLCIFSYA